MNLANAQRDPAFEARVTSETDGATLGRPVHAFQRATSTMEVAHALAQDGAPEGTLIVAEEQEQGRGRLGRVWSSPPGGLYCSFIVRPRRTSTDIPQLSLVAGLAVAEAIREMTDVYPSIRWPNDLFINEAKVCGILVEAKSGAVVIGIGINVTTAPSELPEGSTSLTAAGATGCEIPRLLGALSKRLSVHYDAWNARGFSAIRDALRPWMGHFGHVVHIAVGSTTFEGTAADLDESGRLVVRLDSGILRAFDMGEVTLLR